jgi:excisionase family DNA binding protein
MQLLDQREAARLLRLSERTLERLRLQGGGPLYVKCGRSVRYRQADIESWIAARVVDSTSAMGGDDA